MEYTIFNTIFILNISRPLGQSDKLICYHAENIFSYFSFLVKQIQLSPTQLIVSYILLHYMEFYMEIVSSRNATSNIHNHSLFVNI